MNAPAGTVATGSPFRGCPVEGAFASYDLAGAHQLLFPTYPASLVADPVGTSVARFGWTDAATVYNTRRNADDVLGFVGSVYGTWQRVYADATGRVWTARAGLPVTLYQAGTFWARFVAGAYGGDPVYASLVDGGAVSGYASNAELTKWSVMTACQPGELAIISTWGELCRN